MIQFSLYKLELPLNYHDHVLQLSHTKIFKNIVFCILQFLIYYYYINNIKMLTCAHYFLLKTKLLLDWHSMSHVVITSLIKDHVYIFYQNDKSIVRLTQHVTCHYVINDCMYIWLKCMIEIIKTHPVTMHETFIYLSPLMSYIYL